MSFDRAIALHFAPGTCARVPRIVLEELGVPFEERLVAFMAGDHRKPDFLAKNPAGKVPVLEIDGLVLTQNPAILLYLARRYPTANLLPDLDSASGEAAAVSLLSWFSADLHPIVTRIRIPHMLCDAPGGAERLREQAYSAMALQLAGLEEKMGDRPWVAGDRWTAFDAYLHWIWFRIIGAGFDEAPFPNLAGHHARMCKRASVQAVEARDAAALAELEARGLSFPLR